MATTRADTLAIVSKGKWVTRQTTLVSELSATVVDKTKITAVVKTKAT